MMKAILLVLCAQMLVGLVQGFVPSSPRFATVTTATATHQRLQPLAASFNNNNHDNNNINNNPMKLFKQMENTLKSALVAAAFALSTSTILAPPAHATDAAGSVRIASCLFKKCQLPLAKCIANPKCLANVICINTCNGKEDETGCQIECGNFWENDVVGEFNKCAVSDMECVPQKKDDGSYPIPAKENMVSAFDTKLWNGRWYITAGQNELFDRFPCQVHFFTETKPGTFFGKLNWRIEEPDGEFFTRDAIQQFVQDPDQPAHLANHDNEYLHYQDDWYIIDYEYDDNKDGVPPFAFVYYRGSNDAWDGYGGVVVYTRTAKLPDELIPRLRAAAAKVNFDYDKDFGACDNSCSLMDSKERLGLREKFAGKVALQTEKQVQAAATRVRGNAANGVKAQQMFVKEEIGQAEKAFEELSAKTKEFENEIVQDAENIEGFAEKIVLDAEKAVGIAK